MLNRHIQKELEALLKIMPVVLIRGPRQSGKTTLTQMLKQNGYTYYTLDEDSVLSYASRDPSGWISLIEKPAIIDEVQKVPEIFLPIKRDADQNRISGRYLLTGSANPLLLPRLGDSLAGRMGILELFPFSQGEIRQTKEHFIENIFSQEFPFKNFSPLPKEQLHQILIRGGFPPVQTLEIRDINRWISSYLQTMMERDVRDISNIEGLRELPMLFRLLATRSGNLLNVSDIARSLGMVGQTLKRYIGLLEALFFIFLLPPWFTNLGKRIIKAPKLHLCDTAFLTYLMGINLETLNQDPILMGRILETFVFTELQKMKSWSFPMQFEMFHFRDNNFEVDFVLERPDGTIVGIEVKSARTIRTDDWKGLIHLKSLAKKKFLRGIVLYSGDQILPIEKDLWAVPLQALWDY